MGERFLNALFGFYFLFSNMRNAHGLMTDNIQREVYAQQKGGVHIGDFDRIADYLNTDLQHVAGFTLGMACLFLLLPIFCYLAKPLKR